MHSHENKGKLYGYSETEMESEGGVTVVRMRFVWRAGVWIIQGSFLNRQA